MPRIKTIFLILCVVFVLVSTAYAQDNRVDAGAVSINLPDGWVTTAVEGGLYLGNSDVAIIAAQSFTAGFYEALTGFTLPEKEVTGNTDTIAGAMLLVLDTEIAMQNEDISTALTATDVDRTTVDGRRALYDSETDDSRGLIQFAGLIDDREAIVVMIGVGTPSAISSREFIALFSSIEYEAELATAPETETDSQPEPAVPGDALPFNGLSLGSVVDMRDAVSPVNTALSPDGSRLAVFTPEGLCVSEVSSSGASSQQVCASGDTEGFQSARLAWSPDSRYIAVHEDAARLFVESDIWVMDTNSGDLTNLTDEGYSGRVFPPSAFEEQGFSSIELDISPVWHGSDIYFFRTEFSSSDERPSGYYRVNVENPGQVELVAELSTDTEEMLSAYVPADILMLSGPMAVSPSGRYLVAVHNTANTDESNILLVDIEAGTVEPLVEVEALQAGLPGFVDGLAYLGGVGWVGDESAVLVSTFIPGQTRVSNVYQVSLSGEVLPLVMHDSVTNPSDMAVGDPSPIMYSPYDAQILPDGSALVWQGFSDGQLAVWAAALPLTESFSPENTPTAIYTDEARPFRFRASLGQDGSDVRLLYGANLILMERE